MKLRGVLLGIVMLGGVWHTAAAQPKKDRFPIQAPAIEKVLAGRSLPSSPVIESLMSSKAEPQMPLGPQDMLKSYEIAMSLVADKTSADFGVIVQAQQANQISREQAEYLIQQRYQTAMMQYQVLSALHDVLKHDIDEAGQQPNSSLKITRSDPALTAPFSAAGSGR